MASCFNLLCGVDADGDGGDLDTGRGKVVYDADPDEHRDTTKKGHLSRRTRIYGREDDRDAVRALLLGPGHGFNPAVVTIVGIAGIGKTTLARYVYNDEEVGKYFECRPWFSASEELDVAGLLMEIIRSTGGDLDALEDIRVAVGGKRLLVVLDNVWEESIEALIQFRSSLGDVTEGSKILITTRSSRVAAALGGDGSAAYPLKGLSDEDCWKLFRQKAFGGQREETEQLERIGREIVGKFQGVPLTAIAIGSLLYFERDRSVWENVRDSEIWELPEIAKQTLGALKLSYDHLPPHLKRCFEYCSLLPKAAYEIDSKKLVDLWTGEGIISSTSSASALPEDVGSAYFHDLLFRSFFHEEEEQTNLIIYKMHDLFHDLARSIVGDKHSTMDAGKSASSIPRGCRRLGLSCACDTSAIPEFVYRSERLETFVLFMRDDWLETPDKCSIKEISPKFFSCLRHLRLLDLGYIGITELPRSIGKLNHLRSLDLSGTQIETLPESVGRLRNLRILILENCDKLQRLPHSVKKLRCLNILDLSSCHILQELPEGICELHKLTHLKLDGCLFLTRLPRGIGRLVDLRVLSQFPVDEEQGSCIAELRNLNLKGKINIWNLGNLRSPADARRANMREKSQLRRLELRWRLDFTGEHVNWIARYPVDDAKEVLEGFQPHPNLEKLTIGGYWGSDLPDWMSPSSIGASLAHLVKITLEEFGECDALPALGELPSLKILKIVSFPALKHLTGEFYGDGVFPSLEEMKISRLPLLEEWTPPVDGRKSFPCLGRLEIDSCPRLRAIPQLPCLKVLRTSKAGEELLSSGIRGGWSLPSLKYLSISHCGGASSGWEGLVSFPALETLAITHCPAASLPDGVRHLSSLVSLTVKHLPNLSVLPPWLGSLGSLRSLKIHFCPKLANLHEAVRCLRSLQSLDVWGDSSLWRQYEMDEEDWSHRHNITFQMWGDLTVSDPEQEWEGALTSNLLG